MDIRVLRYFMAVVKEQNIIGAARALHLTQPTLSRQLMDLEEELGCKLFTRSNRKIELTTEGHFLYKRAEEITMLVDKTTAQFNAPEEIISGNVFIGGAETKSFSNIAKVMKKINAQNPQIQFHLSSGNADEIIDRLDNGVFDFAIFADTPDLHKYNYITLPYEDTWGVLMHKDMPLAAMKKITPEMLWNVPLICSSQSMISNKFSGWMKKDFSELNVVATYNLIYNASLLAEEGLGYVMCYDRLINVTGNSNLCFRPLTPKITSGIDIAWKKNQIFTKQAALFLRELQHELAIK